MNTAAQIPNSPLNILIVDDHPGFRALIRQLLSDCAAIVQFGSPRITECSSGEEALRVVTETLPDLVTMDLCMGGMNGEECIRRLRPTIPRAVMIVVTQLREVLVTERSLLAGADAVVCKDDLSAIPMLLHDCLAPAGAA